MNTTNNTVLEFIKDQGGTARESELCNHFGKDDDLYEAISYLVNEGLMLEDDQGLETNPEADPIYTLTEKGKR